jgi:hypothetical protein
MASYASFLCKNATTLHGGEELTNLVFLKQEI